MSPAKRKPVAIGSDRQLFVDPFWIDSSAQVERRLHEPIRRERVITAEMPWEKGGVSYMVALRDEDRFRAWYRCNSSMTPEKQIPMPLIGYAESEDGIRWDKPDLGLLTYASSKNNNLVWAGPGNNMAPFRDDNPEASGQERYKAIVRTREVYALTSADGLRWRLMQEEPILSEGPFDSHNIAFWDAWRGEYVIYCRGVAGAGNFKGGVRWIRRATSPDFRVWSSPEPIDCGDAPFEHLYTNACVPYERARGTYLMFPSRFVPDREPVADWPYGAGVSDIVFMSSRDGLRFDRSFPEAFVRPGPDPDNWHERGIYMERGILRTGPTELSLYGMENWRMPTVCIRRYSLRVDGFVSMRAGYGGGTFATRPLVFGGKKLELNYATSAVGHVRVEIQDESGAPLPGFSLERSAELFGDQIEGTVRWQGDPDLGALAGRPVRLRFRLRDADLYAFRFR